MKLDTEEQAFSDSYDRGEWTSVPNLEREAASAKKKTVRDIVDSFDRGESVIAVKKVGTTKAIAKTQKINVNFPAWMVTALDDEEK